MRILNQDDDKPIKNVLLMLTPREAKELSDSIPQLAIEKSDHIHVNDDSFEREITVAIYTPENTHFYHRRIIELIEKEK